MANKERIIEVYKLGKYGRVLELGPYNGYDTVHLCEHSRKVVCLEARAENIKRTLSTLEIAGVEAEVISGDLEDFDLRLLGEFDIVFASGVIYHMSEPVGLIQRIKQVTKRCLGWSHLASKYEGRRDGWAGMPYSEAVEFPLAGTTDQSWWLTPREFARAWEQDGWAFKYLTVPEPHENGGLEAQFMAWKADYTK